MSAIKNTWVVQSSKTRRFIKKNGKLATGDVKISSLLTFSSPYDAQEWANNNQPNNNDYFGAFRLIDL